MVFEMLQYEFMQNAILAGITASIICGVVGVFVVLKRIVFISDGIAHTSFGGVGLGYLLGINPMITTLFFALASALGIGAVSKRARLHEDTIIGIMMALGMALGILFIGLSEGYAPDLFSYLFGNILAVSKTDIYLMLILAVIIIAAVTALYKEFVLMAFDEEYAKASGLPAAMLYYLFLLIVALTVVILIKIVGIILLIALLTLPAATSKQLTNNLKHMIILSIALGVIYVLAGIYLSSLFNLPSGATIIVVSAIVFFVQLALKPGGKARRLRGNSDSGTQAAAGEPTARYGD